MPRLKRIVDLVQHFEPSIDRPPSELVHTLNAPLKIHFKGGLVANLHHQDPGFVPHAEVLRDLHRFGLSVYVEIDPAKQSITKVLVPIPGKVAGLSKDGAGNQRVQLENSPGYLTLKRRNRNFAKLLETLKSARRKGSWVLITETEDDPQIVDIRTVSGVPEPEPRKRGVSASVKSGRATGAVTPERAMKLFHMLSGDTCNANIPVAPCIPFLYVRDGCQGRAHEMCRLLIAAGVQPVKVWNYGSPLTVDTENSVQCQVEWSFHVAPVLRVQTPGRAKSQAMVIDPSLFTEPVPKAQWIKRQAGSTKSAVTSADAFLRSSSGQVQLDRDFSQTNQVLAIFRAKLRILSASQAGPPPYSKCISTPVNSVSAHSGAGQSLG